MSVTLHPSGPFSGPSAPGDLPSGLSDPGDPASEFVAMAIYL